MRIQIQPSSFTVWLSADDTYEWANRPGKRWPCSQLSGKRVRAVFDRSGLVDLAIDGADGDCDAGEFNAILADYLEGKLPADHPARPR